MVRGVKMLSGSEKLVFEKTDVPVVVLYAYHYGQLGVMRSLGRVGVAVHEVSPHRRDAPLFSRYCQSRFFCDVDKSSPSAAVDYLLKVGQAIGKRSILINTTDNGSNLLAEHADLLSEWFIFPRLSSQLIFSLTSKKEMNALAAKWGVPTAKVFVPSCVSDVEAYGETAVFPVMIKEIYRGASLGSGKRMFIAKSRAELVRLYGENEDLASPNFMLQEYIPGGDDSIWMFNGYFNEHSDCLFSLTGRKLRQSPIHTGVTSLGVCLRNDAIDEMTRRLMKGIGYRGMVDIGFRYDARDGLYKVLDINPRIGSSFRLFVGDNGLDVVRAEYLDLTGQKVPSSRLLQGRKWVVEERDLVSSVRYFREGSLGFRDWAGSFRGVREGAWFAGDDLRPFFVMCGQFVKRALSRSGGGALNPYSIVG